MIITPFDYQDQPVRVVTIDGEPWFVLADLARVLDIASTARPNPRTGRAGSQAPAHRAAQNEPHVGWHTAARPQSATVSPK